MSTETLIVCHFQISDYVYLIHDGARSTIDAAEWHVLVKSLETASMTDESHSDASPLPRQQPSSRRSPLPPQASQPKKRALRPMLAASQRRRQSAFSMANSPAWTDKSAQVSVARSSPAAAAAHTDDRLMGEIQQRVEELFARAEAAVLLRGQEDPTTLPPTPMDERYFKQATSLVKGLKVSKDGRTFESCGRWLTWYPRHLLLLQTSLYPLVHQAEETLRALRQRHAEQLSLFLSSDELAAIAENSEYFANAILDDILTVRVFFLTFFLRELGISRCVCRLFLSRF